MSFFSIDFLFLSSAVLLASIPFRSFPNAYKLFLSAASLIYLGTWGLASPAAVLLLYALFLLHRAQPSRLLYGIILLVTAAITFSGKLLSDGYYETVTVGPLFIVGAAFLGLQFYSLLQDDGNSSRSIKRPSRLDALLYLSYFPKALVGPICRWRHFDISQRDLSLGWSVVWQSMFLISLGLFKNTVISTRLAAIVKESGSTLTLSDSWLLSYVVFFQGYCDFSSYVDVATGLSLLLGISLPPNFKTPYFATGPGDFWRRWHISFWQWARDYIYFPVFARSRNMTLAMLAVFSFAAAWHRIHPGVTAFFLLSFAAIRGEAKFFPASAAPPSLLAKMLRISLQFHLTCLLFLMMYLCFFSTKDWIPSYTFDMARTSAIYFRQGPVETLILAATLGLMVVIETLDLGSRSTVARAAAACVLFFLVSVFFRSDSYIFFYIRM